MFKKNKVATMLTTMGLLLSIPLSAYADPVDVQNQDSQFSLVGGNIQMTAQPVIFDTKQISSDDWKGVAVSSSVTLTDDTGRGDGWSISLSAEDFKSPELPDPSSGGNGTYVLSFPNSSVEVRAARVYANSGQEVDPTHGPLAKGFFLSSSPQTLLSADPGFGMGDYETSPTFALTSVPKTVTVAQLSGSGSSYEVGDSVGAVATTYTSVLTYTLATGI